MQNLLKVLLLGTVLVSTKLWADSATSATPQFTVSYDASGKMVGITQTPNLPSVSNSLSGVGGNFNSEYLSVVDQMKIAESNLLTQPTVFNLGDGTEAVIAPTVNTTGIVDHIQSAVVTTPEAPILTANLNPGTATSSPTVSLPSSSSAPTVVPDYSGPFSGYESGGDLITANGTFTGQGNGLYTGPNGSGTYRFDGSNLVKVDSVSSGAGSAGSGSSAVMSMEEAMTKAGEEGLSGSEQYARALDIRNASASVGAGSGAASSSAASISAAAQAAANTAAMSVMVEAGSKAVTEAITPAMWNAAAQALKETGNAAPTAAQVAEKVGTMFKPELTEAATKAIDGVKDAAIKAGAEAAEELGASTEKALEAGEKAVADGAGKAAEKSVEAGSKAAGEAVSGIFSPVMISNVPQYVILIMQALEGNKQDDATKEVTVKGAEPMQDSQGSQGSGASTASVASSAMSGTTIASSANALINLLKMGKIDLGLLSTDIKKEEQKEEKPSVIASAGKSGADVGASTQTSTQDEEETLTTEEQREIMHRRALLLGEWATAATQIGEGSNAISRAFYDRAAAFAAAANAAQGSLGGITAITDTDRFVLFEITRGAALSAVQLGLQGAANLNDLEEVIMSSSSSNASEKPSISAGGAKSQ